MSGAQFPAAPLPAPPPTPELGQPRPDSDRKGSGLRGARTLRAAAVVGASGACFTVANILLARFLPTEEYAHFTLANGVLNVTVALSLLGADGIVNRRQLRPGPAIRRQVGISAAITGVGAALAAAFLYALPAMLVVMLAGLITITAAGRFTGAYHQGQQRIGTALFYNQGFNFVMLVSAIMTGLLGSRRAETPLAGMVAGLALVVGYGWMRMSADPETSEPVAFPWREGLSFAGLIAASEFLIQLDRLLVPKVLPLDDLATFGVLAAIVIAPFRVLAQSAAFVLVPTLRAAPSAERRRHIVRSEGLIVGLVVAAAAVAAPLAAPLSRYLVGDKYHLSQALIWAAVVTGAVKVVTGFAKGCVGALATTAELGRMNLAGVAAVGLGIVCGLAGARYGLPGLLYGVGIGWAFEALAAAAIVRPHLYENPVHAAESRGAEPTSL